MSGCAFFSSSTVILSSNVLFEFPNNKITIKFAVCTRTPTRETSAVLPVHLGPMQCKQTTKLSTHRHTNTFHLFTLYAFIHKCILKYRKCKHGTQLWGRTLCTHWNRWIARSHTWLFEPFTIAECYFYCDMQSDLRVAKTRSEPCVDVCVCVSVCPNQVYAIGRILRDI